jgi:hypothetical protein
MTDQEPLTPTNAPAPLPAVDRLSILDLLIWTGCIAFCLGWLRWMQRIDGSEWFVESRALWVAQAGVAGTALTGLLVVRPWSARRRGISLAPGEWLWWLLGIESLLEKLLLTAQVVAIRQVSGGVEMPDWSLIFPVVAVYMLAVAGLSGAMAACYLVVSQRLTATPAWKRFFQWYGGLMILESASALLYTLDMLAPWGMMDAPQNSALWLVIVGGLRVLLLPGVAVLLVRDWRSGQPLPWRHGMGGVVFLIVSAFAVIWFLLRG